MNRLISLSSGWRNKNICLVAFRFVAANRGTRARMVIVVSSTQVLVSNMRVDLRRGNVAVAQQRLH